MENGLVGYVRNRGDAGVEIVVEGKIKNVKRFLTLLRKQNPPLSKIYDLSVQDSEDQGFFRQFSIVKSHKEGNLSGSIIPYDVAICNLCLKELRDAKNRRYDYFFITCTQCGPRYTTINGLPYDRENTTMKGFPMCKDCRAEYSNPSDRRFHAQTIACTKCGPTAFLTNNRGKKIILNDPIREAGNLIEAGFIVAIKGNGGFHLATSTQCSDPIFRLRNVKHRSQKPFAVMAKSLKAAKTFAYINKVEEKLLTSSIRPIILLKKREDICLSELISPSLNTIGVMLPYTGLHYMLFDDVTEPAFIMTSANKVSEPIVINNQMATKKLGSLVDFFLFHNRDIAQRCDDSVLRVHSGRKKLIRRSRGYAPVPIFLHKQKGNSLGVGAEENVNSCIITGNRAFISQHIGDIENVETFEYLRQTTQHLMDLTKVHIEAVGCDLHPRFITQKLAEEYGKAFDCPVFRIQHHYAHLLSLMGEWGLSEIVGIVCDGAGYGSNGVIWGGEVIHCTLTDFKRLGHLQEQPMVGGDLATKYPLRMVAGILNQEPKIYDWLYSKAKHFSYGKKEIEVIFTQLEKKTFPMTTSCGRILDAISAILGICYERTYPGEPAMKLEALATQGKDKLRLKPRIEGNIVDTHYILQEVFARKDLYSNADLAYSVETYLAKALAFIALKEAEKRRVKFIGFSGGVAYNEHITKKIRKIVENHGVNFFVHEKVPPGDGGISFGQAIGALKQKQCLH